ncbi:unnamed protein product [Peniophora sp. CBMAI 1063]|nr:unnamed protein product [Peniophora sp. CBMAI 1063]
MSYLLHEDGQRIVDDYPGDASVIYGAFYDKETDVLEPWRSIPRNIDLSRYMYIVPGQRRGSAVREYRILYQPTIRPHDNANCPWSVTLALYGFIDSMNLSPTGNWNQTLQGARTALQWIKLTGGRIRGPFRAQGLALSEVEQHIIGTLRGCGLPVTDQNAMKRNRQKELKLGRRVFEMVTKQTPPSIPVTGPAAEIDRKWRITSTVKLGYRQSDMQIKACGVAKFSPGDFVQTVVKVIALVQPGKNNTVTAVNVRFDLVSCIRLLSSKEAKETMSAAVDTPMPVERDENVQNEFHDAMDEGPDML